MKLKLFVKLYASYILIIVNGLFNVYNNPMAGIGIFLIVGLFVHNYNRTGFVKRRMIVLIVIGLIIHVYHFGVNEYLFMSIVLNFLIIRLYIPYRPKVKQVLKLIDLNLPLRLYYNRINQSDVDHEFDGLLRQSEMDWLSYKILYESNELNHVIKVYTDDEVIGQNFHVNIM